MEIRHGIATQLDASRAQSLESRVRSPVGKYVPSRGRGRCRMQGGGIWYLKHFNSKASELQASGDPPRREGKPEAAASEKDAARKLRVRLLSLRYTEIIPFGEVQIILK